MIWIVYIPPVYDGLEILSPGRTYVLRTAPSAEFIAYIESVGGTIKVMEDPLNGDGDTTISLDGDDSEINNDDYGDYVEMPDQYETEVDIDIEDEEGNTVDVDPYTQYQPKNIVVGNPEPALPLYSAAGNASYIYLLDNESGITLDSWTDADYNLISSGTKSNFCISDEGILFFWYPKDEGYPLTTHIHVRVIDTGGSVYSILDHSGGSDESSTFLAFDRVTERLYVQAQGTTSSNHTTLYGSARPIPGSGSGAHPVARC